MNSKKNLAPILEQNDANDLANAFYQLTYNMQGAIDLLKPPIFNNTVDNLKDAKKQPKIHGSNKSHTALFSGQIKELPNKINVSPTIKETWLPKKYKINLSKLGPQK